MIPVCTSATVRERDHLVIEQVAVPGRVLMEFAGRRAAEVIHTEAPGGTVAILCGPGNNGGDGFVVARWLALWGRRVRVCLTRAPVMGCPRQPCTLDAVSVQPASTPSALSEALHGADIVVDALLGTGQRSAPRGAIEDVVRGIRAHLTSHPAPVRVLALDLPHGNLRRHGGAAWRPRPGGTSSPHHHLRVLETGVSPCAGGDIQRRHHGGRHRPRPRTTGRLAALRTRRLAVHGCRRGWLAPAAVTACGQVGPRACRRPRWGRRCGARMPGASPAGCGMVTLLAPRATWPELHGLDPSVILAEPTAFDPRRHDALVIGPGLGLDASRKCTPRGSPPRCP